MQLMWLSGPTAEVVSVSIGRRTVLTAVLAVAVALVALGGLLQLLGIRIAIEADPTLARTLGGVTSATEQQRIQQRYETQIAQLERRVEGLTRKVNVLESTKQAIVDLIPSASARKNGLAGLGGQGGPLRRILDFEWFAPRVVDGLVKLSSASHALDQRVGHLQATWDTERHLMQALPLRRPIGVEHVVSSEFGVRHDPIAGGLARHAGLDYVAAHGAPILATAPGVVVHAGPHGAYGLAVDIDHGGGFGTRYAHSSAVLVKEGDRVEAGQVIARLGSTGRSTGPHLHYEVHWQGQAINPAAGDVLAVARTRQAPISLAAAERGHEE